LETLMHGFELEARSGDIPVDYNRSCKPRVIGQTLDSLQMRERSGASVLVVLREGQALANPEPGLVLRLAHQSTAPISGTGIRSIPNGLISINTQFNPVQLPKQTLPFGLHLSETPNGLAIWRLWPMNSPKTPRF
jgi:hypothetical protein